MPVSSLKSEIRDKDSSLDYVLIGDYYFPDLRLAEEVNVLGRIEQDSTGKMGLHRHRN